MDERKRRLQSLQVAHLRDLGGKRDGMEEIEGTAEIRVIKG